MTWRDYSRVAQGYWLRHARYLEGCRAVAHTIAMANGLKVRDPRRFMPLITDPPIETVIITKDEFTAIANRYKFKKNGNGGRT